MQDVNNLCTPTEEEFAECNSRFNRSLKRGLCEFDRNSTEQEEEAEEEGECSRDGGRTSSSDSEGEEAEDEGDEGEEREKGETSETAQGKEITKDCV